MKQWNDARRVLWITKLSYGATLAAIIASTTANLWAAGSPASAAGAAQGTYDSDGCEQAVKSSPFIPVDIWIYSAVLRLYSMGYIDQVFLGMRPWTRDVVREMLVEAGMNIENANLLGQPTVDDAQGIYESLRQELHFDPDNPCANPDGKIRLESVYSEVRVMTGTPLRDSYHLGQSIVNDYGRPYANGLNNYSGASGFASAGRYLFYFRGEFQGASSSAGYSTALAQTLSNLDSITFQNPSTGLPYFQATIPIGPISTTTRGRVLEAYISAQAFGHIFSFGKQDGWLAPSQGGAFAYSDNAENIYAFHVDRIEPLHIPMLSRITGPFRYNFLIGPLHGHTYIPANSAIPPFQGWVNPGAPWVHLEKVSFRPTHNLEFGFERTVIWGGIGHGPITLKSFLRSFFSLSAPTAAVKNSAQDPGARFGAFEFSYRLPFVRNWLTLYTDSEAHDDVSPASAPRRACFRPGIFLSHVPGIPKLDVRLEAASTDPTSSRSFVGQLGGQFEYWEQIQRQGYTNNGQLFGDWIGRQDKGGQAWITYNLSGNEHIQMEFRNQKAAQDFIPGGTTLNDIGFQVAKRIGKDLEIKGDFTFERFKAPIYLPGERKVTSSSIQITWFPSRNVSF